MPSVEVRTFRRSDRQQLTELVNAHAAAVVPGLGVSVSTVLSQLERQPDEFIIDPWVSARQTLVAEQNQRVAAAAHLVRYAADARVGPAYRNVGEIRWLLFWPEVAISGAPYWTDAAGAADALLTACLRQFEAWGVSRECAEGDLPVRGVYGVPAQWPHVRALYERAGFSHDGHSELVFLARVEDLRRPAAPIAGLGVLRSVGVNGTRLSAVLNDELVGYIEVEVFEEGERRARQAGWADVGNLHVVKGYRRQGIATWLLGQAADWLRLAHVDRLLSYTYLEGQDETGQNYDEDRAFLRASPFIELTTTRRGWTRQQAGAQVN